MPEGLVDLGPDTVALVTLPLLHAFGMTVMHNAVLAVGGTVVLQPRFSAGGAAELVERHRVTFFGGVPTMYVALLHDPAVHADALDALRWCVSGGAPMPAEALHRHPAVAQAAVVGMPDARYGEEVKAVVVLRPGVAPVTGEEIAAWSRLHLAAYKRPRRVEIRDTLPLGPTGKVLKSALRNTPAGRAA